MRVREKKATHEELERSADFLEEAARLRRKEELENLVGNYENMSLKSWMKLVVAFYSDN